MIHFVQYYILKYIMPLVLEARIVTQSGPLLSKLPTLRLQNKNIFKTK